MRFRKYITFILIVVTAVCIVHAQELSHVNVTTLLQDDFDQSLDMLGIGGNPAWLFQRQLSMPLKIQFLQQSSSGDYHYAFEPKNSTGYQYSVEGKKDLSADHVVYGTFGAVQEYRGDRMWSDTKQYDTWNPMIIADSSTGMTDYRGLVLNGTYSGLLTDRWLLGATIKYGVDNGVKRVSPKPLDMQRNIGIELGTAFLLTEKFSLGALLVLKNDKEENDFEPDQTTAQSQAVLFKFRGYDSYQKFTKNSENRIVRTETYGGYIQSAYNSDEVRSAVSAGYKVRFADIVDGGSSPLDQGFCQSEVMEGTWGGSIVLDSITICAEAGISKDHQWTRHPNYSVLLVEQNITNANAGLCLRVPVFGIDLFGGYSVSFRERLLNDYISTLSANISSYTHMVMIGGSAMIDEREKASVWYAMEFVDPAMKRVTVPNPSALYALVGARNFGYETASVFGSSAGFDVTFNGGVFGHCSIGGVFRYRETRSSFIFKAASRSTAEVLFSTDL